MPTLKRVRQAVALGLTALVLAGAASAPAAAAVVPRATSASATTLFGPDLDWAHDAPDGYRDRLGATPSMYALALSYPLTAASTQQWRTAARAVAAEGTALVVSLLPTKDLGSLSADDAKAANALLEEFQSQYGIEQYVRFAPEMNGTWVRWGQQPSAYIADFQALAAVVHAGTSKASMVWEPSYGSGYPFGGAEGRLASLSATDVKLLDTNGDGRLTEADDPYGPYYPGDSAVDWVGMSMFSFGKGGAIAAAGQDVPLERNTAPSAGEVAQRLDETWGYIEPQTEGDFYTRFAAGHDRPLMLDTGALYDPAVGGDSELAVKRGWWSQVLAALPSHPLIQGVTWLEVQRKEAEAGQHEVDWRATADPSIASVLRTALTTSGLIRFGPITTPVTPKDGSAATVQIRQPTGDTGGDQMGWIVWCAAGLAIAFLLCWPAGRLFRRWRYVDDSAGRDLRIDLFRGFIILAVVLTHIEVAGPLSYITVHGVGAITGAEMFVFLSGVVLGMVYPLGVRKFGERAAAIGAVRRAGKQYVVTLVVILIVFALSFVPFLGASTITTFTDRGTGLNGVGAEGRVYDLYPNAPRLLDYPPPWYAVRQLLLLEMGPWPFNIMGLFVVLSLTIPAFVWLIRRRCWWAVLALSWGLYLWQAFDPNAPALPSQFQAVFPLFTWQLLFTHGLVLGYYRQRVVRALTSTVGKILIGIAVVGYAGFLVYLWAGATYGFTPTPFPVSLYGSLYDTAYQRVDMQWGRLVDTALVVVCVYAILTVFWKPISWFIGWLWIPLGQASLYVFIWQVFFVLAVASIPGLDRSSTWQGTVIHVAAIMLLCVMVRRRFLFSVIPR